MQSRVILSASHVRRLGVLCAVSNLHTGVGRSELALVWRARQLYISAPRCRHTLSARHFTHPRTAASASATWTARNYTVAARTHVCQTETRHVHDRDVGHGDDARKGGTTTAGVRCQMNSNEMVDDDADDDADDENDLVSSLIQGTSPRRPNATRIQNSSTRVPSYSDSPARVSTASSPPSSSSSSSSVLLEQKSVSSRSPALNESRTTCIAPSTITPSREHNAQYTRFVRVRRAAHSFLQNHAPPALSFALTASSRARVAWMSLVQPGMVEWLCCMCQSYNYVTRTACRQCNQPCTTSYASCFPPTRQVVLFPTTWVCEECGADNPASTAGSIVNAKARGHLGDNPAGAQTSSAFHGMRSANTNCNDDSAEVSYRAMVHDVLRHMDSHRAKFYCHCCATPFPGVREWYCPTCTHLNAAAATQCATCFTERPASWTCPHCDTARNSVFVDRCSSCGCGRPCHISDSTQCCSVCRTRNDVRWELCATCMSPLASQAAEVPTKETNVNGSASVQLEEGSMVQLNALPPNGECAIGEPSTPPAQPDCRNECCHGHDNKHSSHGIRSIDGIDNENQSCVRTAVLRDNSRIGSNDGKTGIPRCENESNGMSRELSSAVVEGAWWCHHCNVAHRRNASFCDICLRPRRLILDEAAAEVAGQSLHTDGAAQGALQQTLIERRSTGQTTEPLAVLSNEAGNPADDTCAAATQACVDLQSPHDEPPRQNCDTSGARGQQSACSKQSSARGWSEVEQQQRLGLTPGSWQCPYCRQYRVADQLCCCQHPREVAAGYWLCTSCCSINRNERAHCLSCHAAPAPTAWQCPRCHSENAATELICRCCGESHPRRWVCTSCGPPACEMHAGEPACRSCGAARTGSSSLAAHHRGCSNSNSVGKTDNRHSRDDTNTDGTRTSDEATASPTEDNDSNSVVCTVCAAPNYRARRSCFRCHARLQEPYWVCAQCGVRSETCSALRCAHCHAPRVFDIAGQEVWVCELCGSPVYSGGDLPVRRQCPRCGVARSKHGGLTFPSRWRCDGCAVWNVCNRTHCVECQSRRVMADLRTSMTCPQCLRTTAVDVQERCEHCAMSLSDLITDTLSSVVGFFTTETNMTQLVVAAAADSYAANAIAPDTGNDNAGNGVADDSARDATAVSTSELRLSTSQKSEYDVVLSHGDTMPPPPPTLASARQAVSVPCVQEKTAREKITCDSVVCAKVDDTPFITSSAPTPYHAARDDAPSADKDMLGNCESDRQCGEGNEAVLKDECVDYPDEDETDVMLGEDVAVHSTNYRIESWACPTCTNINAEEETHCALCALPRPDEECT